MNRAMPRRSWRKRDIFRLEYPVFLKTENLKLNDAEFAGRSLPGIIRTGCAAIVNPVKRGADSVEIDL